MLLCFVTNVTNPISTYFSKLPANRQERPYGGLFFGEDDSNGGVRIRVVGLAALCQNE